MLTPVMTTTWHCNLPSLLLVPPAEQSELECVEVEYITMPGWKTSIAHKSSFSDLPPNAQAYVRKLEELVGVQSTKTFNVVFLKGRLSLQSTTKSEISVVFRHSPESPSGDR